jgi:signal transduction histidine kinase
MIRPARYGTWPVLVLGFGLLIALIAFLSISALRDAAGIHLEISSIHQAHQKSARILSDVRATMHQSAMLIRDQLLASKGVASEAALGELEEMRAALEEDLADLEALSEPEWEAELAAFRRELGEYWSRTDRILAWTHAERRSLRASFYSREVAPRRVAVFGRTERIDQLAEETLRRALRRMEESRAEHVRSLRRTLLLALSLAFLVAGFSVVRTIQLERRSEQERERAERAEEELRRLSQKLLHAQEEERKSLSRELHDEIGQKLTALRMGIGRLARMRLGPDEEYQETVADAKALAESVLRAARDLAMGLRPSMLDDLGLGPALEWQAREFSRRTGVPASVLVEGNLEEIPETVRTCAYRVAQEALTNCVRHAGASSVRVIVRASPDRLSLQVEDDGVGFPARASSRGLGLIGMEERVRELGGTVSFRSGPRTGASVAIEIPLQGEARR